MILSRRRFSSLVWGSFGAAGLAAAAPALGKDAPPDLPNVFFSPHGKPFRAHPGEPYPVVTWFNRANKKGDGKLDHAEFMADAEAFFTELDINKDDQLDPFEVSMYEHRVAPEILGYRVKLASAVNLGGIHREGAVLWLAQDQGPGSPGQSGPFSPGGPGSPQLGPDLDSVDPGGGQPRNSTVRPQEDVGTGAAPYSLLDEAEPVTAADADFIFKGAVRKSHFLRHADDHFTALDPAGLGYLALANLPKTPLQKILERGRHMDMAIRIGK